MPLVAQPGSDAALAQQAAAAPPTPKNPGFSIFGWRPSMPNLGGITAAKQLVSGIVGLPELGAGLAVGDRETWNNFVNGTLSSIGSVAATAGKAVGLPGTDFNLGDRVVEPAFNALSGVHAEDLLQESRREGPIAAFTNQALTVAGIAAPIAGSLGRAAGAAEDAAAGARAAAAAAEGTDAGEAAAEAAATQSARAAQLARQAGIAHQFAHPFGTILRAGADITAAAREAAFPATSASEATAAAPHEVVAGQQLQSTLAEEAHQSIVNALKASAAPEAAAAATAARAPLEEAALAAARAEEASPTKVAATNEELLQGHAGPTKTYYRGEPAAHAEAARGTSFTSNPKYAQNFAGEGGRVYRVELPTDEHGTPTVGTPASRPNVGWDLSTASDWADAAKPLGEKAAAEPAIPNTFGQVANPRPEAAAGEATQTIEATAEGEAPRASATAEAQAKRLSTPAPAWAVRLTDALPDSVNRVLAYMNKPIDSFRLHAVARDLARYVELAQRAARQSPSVVEATAAARELMQAVPGLERINVSNMVGEEIAARLDGTALVEAAVKATANDNPVLERALRTVARRGYTGITDEVRAALTPEQAAALESHLDSAVEAHRTAATERLNTLLQSTRGAQGLEQALLHDSSPVMTPKQVKMYRQAMTDLRRAAVRQSQVPEEVSAMQAAAERAELSKEKLAAEAVQARALVGVSIRSAETLHDGVPPGVANIDETVANIMEATIRDQGVTYDVGLGAPAELATTGFQVGMAEQFDVPLEQFMEQGPALIREAVLNPKSMDGIPYGTGVWHGTDAKLGTWVHVGQDGRQYVAADIGMNTLHGEAFDQVTASVIGEAHAQQAIWDIANQREIFLSQTPEVQNLNAHYLSDIMNPRSDISRVSREMQRAAEGAAGITADDVVKELRIMQTWDYSMQRSNPEYTPGDYFKRAAFSFGKVEPRDANWLAQTVLHLSTHEGVMQALQSLDARTVSDALAWYYDSHDYAESTWRGKDVTLLNGETRDAAEVFYDLVAVSSVMASPTQNLGRALSGLANMGDFMDAHAKSLAAAKSLMERLDKTPADVVYVKNIGKEGEQIVGKGEGTALSRRFLTPEVRALTEKTSMTNSPKYNVFDVLSGRLKLSEATTADVARLPEWWTGSAKSLSADNLPRANVTAMLDTLGVTGPAADAYKEWATTHSDLAATRATIAALKDANKAAGIKNIAADMLADTPYKTYADLERAYKASKAAEAPLLEDPGVARAYDQALMEHHGSNALAKLRSFRSNLADPHASLGVTLDSVMAQLYGFSSTDWAGGGTYATHANEIRDAAQMLTERFGHDVKPHEVQALLWVYTKLETGRQDWGRLLGHHDVAQAQLDSMEQRAAAGEPVNPRAFDPLGDYYEEELGYSKDMLDARQQKTYLAKVARTGKATPQQLEELASLRAADLNAVRESTVEVAAHRENVTARPKGESGVFQSRLQIPDNAKVVDAKTAQFSNYAAARREIQQSLEAGDYDQARKILTSYVVRLKKSVLGDAGGSFQQVGEATRADEASVAHAAEERLKLARSVPAPGDWHSNYISPLAARYNREVGLPAPQPIDLAAQVNPARTAEVAQAVRDMLQRQADGTMTAAEHTQVEQSYRALQAAIDSQYEFMTNRLGMNVQYVAPDHEYGIGTLGDTPQPDAVRAAHAAMVEDVRNGNLKVRGTALAGDGPNEYMGETSPQHGVMYNDMLRAVHDFFGHAQAANDFGRHGENIAMMLHDQTLPEEAKAAWYTEFRAQTALAVDSGTGFLDAQPMGILPDAMRQPDYMLRGDTTELHQRWMGQIRGATATTADQTGRLTMRLFHDAAIDTLMHEGGHLLRQMLPADDLALMEREYPGISAGDLTPERRAAEEAFVSDMMLYARRAVRTGDLTGPMSDVFRRVAATFEEQHAAWLDGLTGRTTTPEVTSFWNRMFHPDIIAPTTYDDPISAQRVAPGGVETKRFRWESDAQFAQRVRQYGEARQSVETARIKAQQATQRATIADRAAQDMWAAVAGPTESGAEAERLSARAQATLQKLGTQLEDPTTRQVPAAWQPLWDSFKSLHEDAKLDETGQLAQLLTDIPKNFSEVLQFAAERGFDPTHVQDLTWEQAQKYLFQHITLGVNEEESSLRQQRTGALSNAGIANRSIEALAAGTVAATKEVYTNQLVRFIEENYARPLTSGAKLPERWVPWAPERQYVLSGSRPNGDLIAPGANLMVPKEVADALRAMSKSYDHWAFRMVTRVTKPWRTYLMSLSPKWYIGHFMGNVGLGVAEGVRLQDVMQAIREYRTGTTPDDIVSRAFSQAMDEPGNRTLIPRTIKQALDAEGKGAAWNEMRRRVLKVNDVLDQVSRTAVYDKMLRTGATREAALTRAYTALVDYGDLGPMERAVVRSAIPFYAWQKGILKLVARFPNDHPLAAAVMLQLGRAHEETLKDHLGGSIPDAYLGLTKVGSHEVNLTPWNPFSQGLNLVTPGGIAQSLNPGLDMLFRDAYNAPRSGTGYSGMSPTGRPAQRVNFAQALAQQLAGTPQARVIDQLSSGTDVYGQSPGIAGSLTQLLGAPRAYDPTQVAAIAKQVMGTNKVPAPTTAVKPTANQLPMNPTFPTKVAKSTSPHLRLPRQKKVKLTKFGHSRLRRAIRIPKH